MREYTKGKLFIAMVLEEFGLRIFRGFRNVSLRDRAYGQNTIFDNFFLLRVLDGLFRILCKCYLSITFDNCMVRS